MIGDPQVEVRCDGKPSCAMKICCDMTPLARRIWDGRNILDELKSAGWIIDGDSTYCSKECAEAAGVEVPK